MLCYIRVSSKLKSTEIAQKFGATRHRIFMGVKVAESRNYEKKVAETSTSLQAHLQNRWREDLIFLSLTPYYQN